MAVSKLVLTFATADGTTTTLAYNYAKSTVQDIAVRDLVSGIISSGSIFSHVPVIAKSAKFITATEKDVELE